MRVNCCALAFVLVTTNIYPQIDSSRKLLVASLCKNISKNYVSKELGKRMCDSIIYKLNTGMYDVETTPDDFLFQITTDLRRISKDYHIVVTPVYATNVDFYLSKWANLDASKSETKDFFSTNLDQSKRLLNEYKERTKNDMFSYGDIKILPGNIGYVEIIDFVTTSYFTEKNKNRISIESVFKYLRNTQSIIIDLRENQGGSTRMAAKLCSYFSKDPNNYFITTEDFLRYDSSGVEKEATYKTKIYTENKITNKDTKEKRIYILISNRTFSAAELVAYKIKRLVPEVILVGEPSRGGGNGYSTIFKEESYTAIIPSSKSFDEDNSDFNIEGKGVKPDVLCREDSALRAAYFIATNMHFNSEDVNVKYYHKKQVLTDKIDLSKYHDDYIGDYKKIFVTTENSKLYMVYDTFKKTQLTGKTKDIFEAGEFEFVKFIRNSNLRITHIQLKRRDGITETFSKL